MFRYIEIICITAVVFLAMILNLALRQKTSSRIFTACLLITFIGGLLMYGSGFGKVIADTPLAILRTLLAVCGMFVGKNEYAAICQAPWMSSTFVILIFWLIHLAALYATASAAITTVGAEMLKKLQLFLAWRGDLSIIYGCSPEALSLGNECGKEKDMSVVFIDGGTDDGSINMISRMGAAFRTGTSALDPGKAFVSSLGIRPGKRKIHVYCMKDASANYVYAVKLKNAFAAAGILPEQTSLVMLSDDDDLAAGLQRYGETYGYGDVFMFSAQDQAARLLMKKCPPWQEIDFDENGKAEEDFAALIIGFGTFGQSVLKYLVQNGQFAGSHFKATVISSACKEEAGYLQTECPGLFEGYDIDLVDRDGRSTYTFSFVEEHLQTLKYIAVCIGDEKTNNEIAGQLRRFLAARHVTIPVVQCSGTGVRWMAAKGKMEQHGLFTKETLDPRESDRMAMALNYRYDRSAGNMQEAWKNCDYFSRMSSRASADFIGASLKALHLDEKEASTMEKLVLTEEQTENLGRMEHARWCAFHYAMGFKTMTKEEWQARAEQYRKDILEGKKNPIRISKNMPARTHACLVSWEELDELSDRENSVTGKNVNYKQMDIDNILAIPEVLRLRDGIKK